jgi:hypothetical protein
VDAQINYEACGRGTLELEDGARLDCSFALQQYGDGKLVLDCVCDDLSSGWQLFASNSLKSICGQTDDGQDLASHGRLTWLQLDGPRCRLRAQTVVLGNVSLKSAAHRFTLTNLIFADSERNCLPRPVTLVVDGQQVKVHPVDQYVERVAFLRAMRSVHATAWLSVDSLSAAEAIQTASDISYALSIVQGHKVNWIDHAGVDAIQRPIWCSLQDRVTKSYTALPLNRNDGNDRSFALAASTICYPKIRELEGRYKWGGRVIDAWLDARAEGDYIESRAIKFVVVLETLRSIALRDQLPRRHLAESQWSSFVAHMLPAARQVLHQLGCSRDLESALTDQRRWEDLNRKSFRSDIIATFKLLGVEESRRNIELFVSCRNKIIHEGRFRCQAEPEEVASETDAPQKPNDEYSFLASFVDRAILQVFGLKERLGSR